MYVSPFACNGEFRGTIAMSKTVEGFSGKRESAGTKADAKRQNDGCFKAGACLGEVAER